MKKTNELNYKQLKMRCNPELFEFTSTAELDSIDTGIGQDRGIKALEFGINVDVRGYNLYIEGPSRCRENYVHQKLFKYHFKKEKGASRLVLYL